jgi:hypothetical protein
MQIVTIELLNDQALVLLQQLEQLNILRLVGTKKPLERPKRQWAGSISKETVEKMLLVVKNGRE